MICPKCKNEKWDENICPQCGLSEKEALLFAGELFDKAGKVHQATECYEKYLLLEPNNFEVECKMAAGVCSEAISRREPPLFEKADSVTKNILERHWGWEKGHQIRSGLFFCFNQLDMLNNEYELVCQKDESKRKYCEKMITNIKLMKKFMETHPTAYGQYPFEDENEYALWFKSFWPLALGAPVILGGIYAFSKLQNAKDPNSFLYSLITFVVAGSGIIALFLLSMNFYKKNGKREIDVVKKDQN